MLGCGRAKVGSVSSPCRGTLPRPFDEADDQRGSAPVPVLPGHLQALFALHLVCMWLQTQPQKSRPCFIVCSYLGSTLLGAKKTRATGGASRVCTAP